MSTLDLPVRKLVDLGLRGVLGRVDRTVGAFGGRFIRDARALGQIVRLLAQVVGQLIGEIAQVRGEVHRFAARAPARAPHRRTRRSRGPRENLLLNCCDRCPCRLLQFDPLSLPRDLVRKARAPALTPAIRLAIFATVGAMLELAASVALSTAPAARSATAVTRSTRATMLSTLLAMLPTESIVFKMGTSSWSSLPSALASVACDCVSSIPRRMKTYSRPPPMARLAIPMANHMKSCVLI